MIQCINDECMATVCPLRDFDCGIFQGLTWERIRTIFNLPFHVRQRMFVGKAVILNIHGDPTPWRDQPHFEHAKIKASRWTSHLKEDQMSLLPCRVDIAIVGTIQHGERSERRKQFFPFFRSHGSCNAEPTAEGGKTHRPSTSRTVSNGDHNCTFWLKLLRQSGRMSADPFRSVACLISHSSLASLFGLPALLLLIWDPSDCCGLGKGSYGSAH